MAREKRIQEEAECIMRGGGKSRTKGVLLAGEAQFVLERVDDHGGV